MSLIVTNAGLTEMLLDIATGATNLKAMLFKNVLTPVHGGVIADMTECNFTGYARLTLTGWTEAYDVGNSRSYLTHAAFTFTATGGATPNAVDGWALVFTDPGTGSDVLIAYENFSPAYYMQANGDTITITPFLYLTQGSGS